MSDDLDRNIGKLMQRAPEPESSRPGAREEIFARVTERLREKPARKGAAGAPRPRGAKLAWVGTLAAAAAAIAVIVLVGSRTPQKTPGRGPGGDRPGAAGRIVVRELRPAVGAAVSEKLHDGSRIEVAGGSHVKVTRRPRSSRPLVELLSGQVTCEVAGGNGQFKVRTPAGEAIALGTRFSVKLEEQADAELGEKAVGGNEEVNRKTLSALVMTVAVMSGEVLVRDRAGLEQLAAAGETVKVGDTVGKARVADVENFSSGALVPRLEDGTQGKPLEVRKHGVKITVTDQIALVEVDQVFYNDTDRRMEGVFYFPLPGGATISRLAMYVGDRLMEGEIAETQRARRTFEALLVQQQDPALLEWAGGNMFKMRVFPIEAKSEKRVLLSYYQVLKREHGRIRLNYPLASDALQTHPVGEVDIDVTVKSTPRIVSALAPNHKTAEVKSDAGSITARYNVKKVRPASDFVLDYRVARGDGEVVVVPYWHSRDGEGYFLMIFSPELDDADSEKPASSRFVFVIDKSGGFGDRQLALARKSVKHAIGLLKSGDQFGIVAYDTFATTFKPGLVVASDHNRAAACKWLDGLTAMGASDLSAAWKSAAGLAGEKQTQIVYAGSGLSSLTSTRAARLVAEAREELKGARVRLHCLALGDVRDGEFLAELARRFDGTVRPVASADDVTLHVGELMDDYSWPLYTGVRMEFLGVGTSEVYPVWFPNVTAGRQLFAFGKYDRQGKARVRLSAGYKDRPYNREFEIKLDGERSNNFVAKLWANEKIRYLQDSAALAEGEKAGEMVQTVIATSKRYRVMSRYTSFIVLETAEDYERFGIERRADEFGDEDGISDVPLGGTGVTGTMGSGADFWKKDNLKGKRERLGKGGGQGGGNRGKVRTAATEPELPRAEGRARKHDSGSYRKVADEKMSFADPKAAPPPAPPGNAATVPAAKKARGAFYDVYPARDGDIMDKAGKDLAERIDVLSWARQDIFPVFDSNELGRVPYRHRQSPAEALKILEAIGKRYGSLAMKVAAYRLDAKGREKLEGREWKVALDSANRRFYSRKVGDDHFDVSDGKVRVRFFPLLKYAAKRRVTDADLRALASALPAYIFPWAVKLDRSYYITVQKKGDDGVVIRLARRHSKHSYVLLHLKSVNGPVTRIEVFERTGRYRHYSSRKAQTIECSGIRKIGQVEIPTVFRITHHSPKAGRKIDPRELDKFKAMVEMLRASGQKAKAEEIESKFKAMTARSAGTVRIVRLKDVKIGYQPKAADFKVGIPEDWAVRDLDASPRGKDVRPVSRPVNPSGLVR